MVIIRSVTMATVYQVSVNAKNQSKDHSNIWAAFDGNDNGILPDIAQYFLAELLTPMLPVLSDQFIYSSIQIESLTAVNPGTFQLILAIPGQAATDPMPTGVHVNAKLVSADQSFKSGNKLLGGGVENSFTNGEPTDSYLDFIQNVLSLFRTGMGGAIGMDLAIFRPTFSLPGIPEVSIVQSILVRGGSTNNRRLKDFKR